MANLKDNEGTVLGPVTRPPDGMAHCGECGAYLGDYVEGILYKFGQVVTEPHSCESHHEELGVPS